MTAYFYGQDFPTCALCIAPLCVALGRPSPVQHAVLSYWHLAAFSYFNYDSFNNVCVTHLTNNITVMWGALCSSLDRMLSIVVPVIGSKHSKLLPAGKTVALFQKISLAPQIFQPANTFRTQDKQLKI